MLRKFLLLLQRNYKWKFINDITTSRFPPLHEVNYISLCCCYYHYFVSALLYKIMLWFSQKKRKTKPFVIVFKSNNKQHVIVARALQMVETFYFSYVFVVAYIFMLFWLYCNFERNNWSWMNRQKKTTRKNKSYKETFSTREVIIYKDTN